MKEGSVILIDGAEHTVEFGPWRYQQGKKTKTGYGLYVVFDVPFEIDKWNTRCGVESLRDFGIEWKLVK